MNQASSKLSVWILAARPRTLPAAITPVMIGSALAYADAAFAWVPALLCMSFALLVQVATNFANDYFDHIKGADTEARIGPTRACASGLIPPKIMWRATQLTLLLAFLVGCGLIPFGGWWLVAVGIVSLLCAVAYTGGPYPLGYHGWGDVFVILFFGFVAVMFTHFVQTGSFSYASAWLGLGTGLVINNLLIVNNYRDRDTDREAGKRTIIVRFGRRFGQFAYGLSFAVAALVPVVLYWFYADTPLFLLAAIAFAIAGCFRVRQLPKCQSAQDFGRELKAVSISVILYAGLVSLPLLLALRP